MDITNTPKTKEYHLTERLLISRLEKFKLYYELDQNYKTIKQTIKLRTIS